MPLKVDCRAHDVVHWDERPIANFMNHDEESRSLAQRNADLQIYSIELKVVCIEHKSRCSGRPEVASHDV
jgi:hypothetical protein